MSSPAANAAAAAPTAAPAAAAAPTPVWLDCDPGHDDALALILAGHSAALRLIGVSTVAGNQLLSLTTTNALRVLAVSGLAHVPVFEGAAKPLLRPSVVCAEIHGESGLEGPIFPPLHTRAGEAKAFEAMRRAAAECMAAGTPMTLIATGPLTNVALLCLTYPELVNPRAIKAIVLMGGAVGVGNTGPAAEFNIEIDPEAAAIVFEQAARPEGEAVPVVMVPLEVTHTALVTEQVLDDIRAMGAPVASGAVAAAAAAPAPAPAPSVFSKLICDLLLFFRESYLSVFGFSSPPLHDPCAVLYVLRPDLFVSRRMRVDIETHSSLCAGRTVCDVYNRSGKPANVTVALSMDVPAFWRILIDALRRADKCSTLNVEGAHVAAEAIAAEPAPAAATAKVSASGAGTLLVEDGADVSASGPLAVRVQNLPPLQGEVGLAQRADLATAAPTSEMRPA